MYIHMLRHMSKRRSARPMVGSSRETKRHRTAVCSSPHSPLGPTSRKRKIPVGEALHQVAFSGLISLMRRLRNTSSCKAYGAPHFAILHMGSSILHPPWNIARSIDPTVGRCLEQEPPMLSTFLHQGMNILSSNSASGL